MNERSKLEVDFLAPGGRGTCLGHWNCGLTRGKSSWHGR